MSLKVELRAAPLPPPLTKIAVHLYFNVYKDKEEERWELWQTKNAFEAVLTNKNLCNQKSNGHIHRNLKGPLEGVGGGNSFQIATWSESAAESILSQIQKAFCEYQFKDKYLAWPGPNSNTYVAYILSKAGILIPLPGTAIGKNYSGFGCFHLKNFLCLQLLTFGLQLNQNHLEFHGLGMTFGIHWKSKFITHPLLKGLYGPLK